MLSNAVVLRLRIVYQVDVLTKWGKFQLVKLVHYSTGIDSSVELPKRVRPWWFTGEQGQLVLQIHYGSQVLELARGKSSVEVADSTSLVTTLQVVHTAVMAGELDQQIEAAATTLKSRF